MLDDDVLKGAAETVKWEDKVVAAPQWANTQVVWFRKSLAQKAGLDMTKPVTWDQVIDAAAENDGTVGVQANKYEAYVVWINALIQGAGGNILDPATVEKGRDAKVTINSDAGKDAAAVIKKLADSSAAQPDFSTSNEGTSLGQMFPADGAGEFMTNWTFVYKNYEGLIGKPGGPKDKAGFEDLGWARYPADGRGRGVQAADRRHRHRRRRLLQAPRIRPGGRHLRDRRQGSDGARRQRGLDAVAPVGLRLRRAQEGLPR